MKTPLLLLVLILLSGGAVFQVEASLDSRLIDAAEAGEAAEVRKLLSDGASVNAHSSIGKTALMFAAQEGHLGVVELLDEGRIRRIRCGHQIVAKGGCTDQCQGPGWCDRTALGCGARHDGVCSRTPRAGC